MRGDFIIEAWMKLAIALLTIILRLYFSITQKRWRALTLYDSLMVLAGVILEIVLCHLLLTCVDLLP